MDVNSSPRVPGLQTIAAREAVLLAPWAMRSVDSRGRKYPETEHPYRGPFQRDRDRVVHSSAFRRLSGKMQVFTGDMGDYHRTRLTHTHEVASIARTLGRSLRLNEDLIEALALFHDIGHPPFGHAGEEALAECLAECLAGRLPRIDNLLRGALDFCINPGFVHELMEAITAYNLGQIDEAMKYDIDGIELGDDWGQQRGLIMGYDMWKEFIYPYLKRTYRFIKDRGKYVFIHSCGDVDELFDDLAEIGVDCFNPFQPEVMDVRALLKQYHKKLSFWGGLSIQRILPYGTVADVKKETADLIGAGKKGGYIFAPSHAVEGDVPAENIIAFIEAAKTQPGFRI